MLSQDEKLLQRIKLEKEKREAIELEARREKEPNLLNISNALDEYFIYEKLKVYAAFLSYQAYTSKNHIKYNEDDFRFINIILSAVEGINNPLIQIYYLIITIFKNRKHGLHSFKEDEKLLREILILVTNHLDEIEEKEAIKIYSFLTNYCLNKFNHGHFEYAELFLVFNNDIINILFQNNQDSTIVLPPVIFRNMVIAAFRLKKNSRVFRNLRTVGLVPKNQEKGFENVIEWCECFIDYYKNKLSSKHYSLYYPYCAALLSFHKKEFGKAYRILDNPYRIQGLFINMNTRLLHLQIIFELFVSKPMILENDGIDIDKTLETFRGLIRDDVSRKQQLSEYFINYYKTFEKLYRHLYRLQLKYGFIKNKKATFNTEKQKIQDELTKIWYPYKEWIEEKVNSM